MTTLQPLIWIGSSRTDLKSLPSEVQDDIGYSLYQAQLGYFPDQAKLLKGFSGVVEIICNHNKNTYRAIYATKIEKKIYVLHVFQKKSKHGIKTPKEDIELIKRRLQTAHAIARGQL
ncbi:MAG: type II toxin-antitoxin system RelE/ParE family toxin [Legionellales bacterium]|nr:type II toxin-antitoxin system RelE/ParE family toxin [Legionellales bacterium]